MTQIHFKNFKLLEPQYGELRGGYEVPVSYTHLTLPTNREV